MTIKRIGGDAAGSGIRFNRELAKSALSRDAIGVAQLIAFSVRDGIAHREALFGRAVLVRAGDASVGKEARGFEIIEGPALRPVVPAGDLVGEVFDGAVAGFAGAVVGRRVGRRAQEQHAVLVEERTGLGGDEGGAVVGLEHERGSMLGEQRGEEVNGGGGIRRDDGVGGEGGAGGEIADGEDPAEAAIDGRWRFGVVHGPDAPGAGPGDGAVVAACGDVVGFAPGEVEEAGEVAAGEVREVVLEDADAEGGSVQGEEVEHVVALGR